MKRQRGRTWLILVGVLAALALLAAGAYALWPQGEAAAAAPASPVVAAASADGDTFTGIEGCVVRFADVEAARAVLGAADAWVERTGAWQRAVLMARTDRPDLASFQAWQAAAALPWPADARRRWRRALEAIAPAFNRLKVPLPREVLLIHTSGRESANQAHTRANAVVLPAQFGQQSFSDAEVLAHELFHVVSRHQPELANRLYDLIGYHRVGELEWPVAWLPIRIANQDAPFDRHLMRVKVDGRDATVMPVVVSAKPTLPPADGDTLLELMEPRLLEVEPGAGSQRTRPVMKRGQPVWHDPEASPDFLAHLGGNTDYIQHPDETIADNFMFLVSGRAVKNPRLLERIEAVLRANRP
jgi:hypothetical protein